MLPLLLSLGAASLGCPADPVATDDGPSRVAEIVNALTPGQGWSSLSAADQAELEQLAQATLADFRARWGAQGLADKEKTLLAAAAGTDPLTAFDAAFRVRFRSRLAAPDTFSASTDITDPGLRELLLKLHLVHLGARRINAVRYDGLADLDWDGASPIAEFPLPDGDAMAQQRSYA